MRQPILIEKDSTNWVFIPLFPGADILIMTLDNKELCVVFKDDNDSDSSIKEKEWKKNLKKRRKGIRVIYSKLPGDAMGVAMPVKTDSFSCNSCKKRDREAG